DAFIRVDYELVVQFIKAGDRAYLHTIGKFASHTLARNDMRHKDPNICSNNGQKLFRLNEFCNQNLYWLNHLQEALDFVEARAGGFAG
ncbi:MAG: hypothetical protein L0219_12950, partial [Phycisphaerales bacterium]|nr:hypothetical protein [Phycisphaerales bacterium]